ncbi:MAG TPA: 23S rRNA (adenine(2503)-C(2))-methyltransferase RlmN [Thermoanaerobaculia bacterium]|nr:23S rRNA (adenine(2503)-C(2))-methyltransferase RlmN [Thermoanaerobaculia bacterium]
MPPLSDPLGLSRAGWEAAAESLELPRYRGRQIFDALHVRGKRSWAAMAELPGVLRERLAREAPIHLPQIARREESADGSRKYGLLLQDGALVEAVFMPGEVSRAEVNEFEDARVRGEGRGARGEAEQEGTRGDGPAVGVRAEGRGVIGKRSTEPPERYTVCLSSQTGCAVDCAFCVTGRLGGGRNLTAGEILGQLYAVCDDVGRGSEGLRVVFMGMGEPFQNPEGVIGALEVLFEVISPRRVTVSTSGIAPVFRRFAELPRRPNLAVSINAADEETRIRLMPITRAYPLADVLRAMRQWPLESHRRITAEYVLIAGVNDSPEDARRLVRLLRGMAVKVNVIPLNEDPTHLPGWKRPGEGAIDAFARELAGAGVPVTVRRSRGPDARAACGQLKGRTEDVRRRGEGRGARG